MSECSQCGGTGKVIGGDEARKLRHAAGATARSVAKRMKLSPAFLCDLEYDRRRWNHELEMRFRASLR